MNPAHRLSVAIRGHLSSLSERLQGHPGIRNRVGYGALGLLLGFLLAVLWLSRCDSQALAGWVGALGSVGAIFAAWLISRAEYQKNQTQAALAKNNTVDLFQDVISKFETNVMRPCINAWGTENKPELDDLLLEYSTKAEYQALYSLVIQVPSPQWPSIEAYGRGRQYWFSSTEILQAFNGHRKPSLPQAIQARETELHALRAALESSRPSSAKRAASHEYCFVFDFELLGPQGKKGSPR